MPDRKILAAVGRADTAAGRQIESHPAQRPARLIDGSSGTVASGQGPGDRGGRR